MTIDLSRTAAPDDVVTTGPEAPLVVSAPPDPDLAILARLASAIGHELTNALLTITGYGSILAEDLADTAAADDVADILAAADRAAFLARLLMAGRSRRADSTGGSTALDLNATVAHLLRLIQGAAGSSLTIEGTLEQDIPLVVADEAEIGQTVIRFFLDARSKPLPATLRVETAFEPTPDKAGSDAIQPPPHATLTLNTDEGDRPSRNGPRPLTISFPLLNRPGLREGL